MLHKYECDKCDSICYIESEVWESCPICEETPEEQKQRERAEHAEYMKLAAMEKCDSYANRYAQAAKERDELQKRIDRFVQDCGTTMYPCPRCGHGMSSRKGCLHCQRDELYSALYSLLNEAKCYAGTSKHLMRECEEAEQLINKLKSDRSK